MQGVDGRGMIADAGPSNSGPARSSAARADAAILLLRQHEDGIEAALRRIFVGMRPKAASR